MSSKWDKRFINLARHAAEWSKDPRTKVGAVVVNDHRQVIGLGYNGFPRGVRDDDERYADRPTKLSLVAHAERNALDNTFTNTEGATIYSTLYPCNECAKGIIQKGIKRVVTTPIPEDNRHNFQVSAMMFEEAGVDVVLVQDDV
jgi:dCMP deaminase